MAIAKADLTNDANKPLVELVSGLGLNFTLKLNYQSPLKEVSETNLEEIEQVIGSKTFVFIRKVSKLIERYLPGFNLSETFTCNRFHGASEG